MIITAGLGSSDSAKSFMEAGADEFFIGYIPFEWQGERGLASPLNRREVISCGAQIGGRNELLKLKDMGARAAITLNSLSYRPEEYPMIADIIEDCLGIGFDSFIIADPALIVYLNRNGLINRMRLHVSGELGEMNRYTLDEMLRLGAKRVIFNRKVTLPEIGALTKRAPIEYEAFLMNEMCRFSGMFCDSLHCDEMPPVCREEYRLEGMKAPENTCGIDGCGLCALWRLREAGITHLKIVGRGARTEDMLKSVSAARLALDILEESSSEAAFLRTLKKRLPRGICAERCYYTFRV